MKASKQLKPTFTARFEASDIPNTFEQAIAAKHKQAFNAYKAKQLTKGAK